VTIKDVPATDWIFFYSRNGIKYFFQSQAYHTDNQYAVMGPASANTFYEITGRSPKYTGNGVPGDVAHNFLTYEQGRSILFVKAQQSSNSVKELLNNDMDCQDIVAYKNVIKDSIDIPECSHLVFTSSMNAQGYFQKYPYNNEKLYAIGHSTALTIKEIIGKDAAVSENATERSLYQLVHQDLQALKKKEDS
jgi:uroporphyrinogen-III synthase